MTDYKKKWNESDLIPEELKDSKMDIIDDLEKLHKGVDKERTSNKLKDLLSETECNYQLIF